MEIFQNQGLDYTLPPASKFCSIQVIVDENDVPRIAIAARKTTEGFLLCDAEWESPAMRMEAIKMLHVAMAHDLEIKGYDDMNIWVPPQMEKSFGRRLMKSFGWTKQMWPSFAKNVRG